VPEGDTVFRAAAALHAALVGATIDAVAGSHPEVLRHGQRISGRIVTSVASTGKHLLVRFDNGWTLRTHLGMPGRWRIEAAGGPWSRTPGAARVVLEAGRVRAVCYAAPTVQIAPDHIVASAVAHLGVDATADHVDEGEALRRANALPEATTVSKAITDQSVVAGVGNVFKNEILFLERLHPGTPIGMLDTSQVVRLVGRAHRLLLANRTGPVRTTTGDPRRGRRHWVYGRDGRQCLRCGAAILSGWVAGRITYWCPRCQPEPVSS